jgi:hypothetical protein
MVLVKHSLTEEQFRALALGRPFSMDDPSMRIVRDELADVHVGDQVRYTDSFGDDGRKFFNEIGIVTELRGSGWLGVHFPHHAKGTNLQAPIERFRLVACVHAPEFSLEEELERAQETEADAKAALEAARGDVDRIERELEKRA